jgi:hypothetical protein
MNPKKDLSARLLLPLALLAVESACIPQASAGPAPTAQIIVVTATAGTPAPSSAAPSPTPDAVLELPPAWTTTPQPANTNITPATATPASVTMTAGQLLSCVKGPHWQIFNWVAGIKDGETVTVLARSTADWPDYYYVRKSDGTECWAFGGSSTFSGNIYSLPEKEAPPLPETTLTIQNKMYLPITDLFLRPKDETAWGADRTGAGQIDIGATFSLPLTAGFYDLQIRDQFGGVLFEKPDSPIGVDPGSRKFSLEIRFAVVLRNGTADSLCRIEAKASGSPVGDLKIPGDGVVAAGEDASIEAVAGIYDLVLRRCGDDVAVGNITSKYFGPLSTMLVV